MAHSNFETLFLDYLAGIDTPQGHRHSLGKFTYTRTANTQAEFEFSDRL